MTEYPIELRVHVFFGGVVCATLRSHSNELWVTHRGDVVHFPDDDFYELARARGALRSRRFLRCPTTPPTTVANSEAAVHPLVQTLISLLHGDGRARGLWASFLVPTSERLCAAAGVEELRVDWLLGDSELGTRLGETTYIGAAFSGVAPISKVAAAGFLACARANRCVAAEARELTRGDAAIRGSHHM